MKRERIYQLIDEEREYQDQKWGREKINTIEQWLVYIEDYVIEAKHIISRDTPENTWDKCLNNIRKIAAMSVCAMEQYDPLTRQQEELLKKIKTEEQK